MAKVKKFNFESSLLEFNQVNSGFARVKLLVMTDEQVANSTHFSKEVINKKVKSLNYLPIVAEFKSKIEDNKEVGDFGTHGGRIELDDDGFRYVETTMPYGVVIADSYKWENVKLKNGEYTNYLTCEGYVWIERYPELEKLYEGKSNNQSMEIKVLKGSFNEETWVYEIEDFEFLGLCILGSDVAPAFHEAKVLTDYSQNDFKVEYENMIFSLNKYLQESNSKEVFELDKEKLNDNFDENKSADDNEQFENENNEEFEEAKDDNINDENFNDEQENQENVDDYEQEEQNDENFDENKEENTEENYEEKYNSLKLDFDSLTEQFNTLKAENEKLVEFKQEKVREKKKEKVAEFSEKLTDEELSVIYENIDNLTIEEIETKCFALYGMKKDNKDITNKKNTEHIFTHKFTSDKKTQSWFEGFVD